MSDNRGNKAADRKTGGDYVDGHHTSEDVEDLHEGKNKLLGSNKYSIQKAGAYTTDPDRDIQISTE
jgi:hypothetical protein